MAKQGIGTGSSPNDGTGDTLLTGAGKINDNFDEVYGVIGDGTTLFVGIVTQITAGTNVSISTAYGSVEVSAGSTTNLRADTLVVTGISTLGIVTGATYYGDGSNLTGMANTSNVRTNSLNVSGVSTVASLNSTGVVTATSFVGSGVNLTGITTLIEAGDNITLTTDSGITTITSTAIASTAELRANTLEVTGVSTFSSSGVAVTVTNNIFIGGDFEVGFAGSMRGNGSYVTDQRWSISGANPNYTFTGIGITSGNKNNPYLYFQRGGVYEIENTTPNSHPLQIRESAGGAEWIAGVSTYRSSASSVTTRIEVPLNAPNTLVYQCTIHSGMYSTISVYPNALT